MSMKIKDRRGNLKSKSEMPPAVLPTQRVFRQEGGNVDPANAASALQISTNDAGMFMKIKKQLGNLAREARILQ